MLEKNDEQRDKSEDFFKFYQDFFKKIEANLPKEEKKKKGGAGGNQAALMAELKKKQ